jgi:predicted HAD superfamily Cof-like phosphohydrolase
MADSIYVIVGAAIEYGIPLSAVWDAVQKSNLAKRDPSTGKVRRREDGKILKPDGWKPPDIRAALWGTERKT